MQQPSVYIFGIRIDEPVTTATDLLVGLACLYFAFRLKKYYNASTLHKQIIFYFVLMGIATILGGLMGHGFLYAGGFYWKLPGWLLSMVAINLFERVIIHFSGPVLSSKQLRFFSIFNIIELVFFMILAFGTLNFLFVQIHSTYGFLVVIFSFCLYNFRKNHYPEIMKNMIIGLAWIFLCAVIFVAKISISKWFNHADLAHVCMFVGAIYFYKGSKQIMQTS